MTDYISREAALAFPFANGRYDHEYANEHFIFGCESYKKWIEQLPTADVVTRDCYDRLLAENDELRKERPVRHGRWDVYSVKDCLYTCSLCHGLPKDRTRYCPNCGAKMDGDGE